MAMIRTQQDAIREMAKVAGLPECHTLDAFVASAKKAGKKDLASKTGVGQFSTLQALIGLGFTTENATAKLVRILNDEKRDAHRVKLKGAFSEVEYDKNDAVTTLSTMVDKVAACFAGTELGGAIETPFEKLIREATEEMAAEKLAAEKLAAEKLAAENDKPTSKRGK